MCCEALGVATQIIAETIYSVQSNWGVTEEFPPFSLLSLQVYQASSSGVNC